MGPDVADGDGGGGEVVTVPSERECTKGHLV